MLGVIDHRTNPSTGFLVLSPSYIKSRNVSPFLFLYGLMGRYSNKPSRSFYRTPLVTDDLPLDVLPIILDGLASRQDYHTCTLVNKTFNRIATPLLYRELNSRAIPKVNISR